MQDIKPFINLGWWTVPLKGTIERRPDGSKTEPIFEKGWKDKYSTTINTVAARLGGALTGQKSNIIAIDCDSTMTFELFRALDPTYEFVFMSKGKCDQNTGRDKTCGTLVYLYEPAQPDTFQVRDGQIDLDVFSEGGFIYLPTEANKSKEEWTGRLPELKQMPPTTLALLQQLKKRTATPATTTAARTNVATASCLAPLVKQFIDGRKFLPGLFKIITPKDFRSEPQYLQHGYLHPDQVPEGRGSEYLSKISAILGSDISVDEELYTAAMHDINSLWPQPMDSDRLDATIIDPMINKKAAINGQPIWQYDPEWTSYRLILHTKRQSSVELGFDDHRNMYYCVDVVNEHVKDFSQDTALMSYVGSISTTAMTKPELKAALPIINVTSHPNRQFGFTAGDDPIVRTLNVFVRTPELTILEDPQAYAPLYRHPSTVLRFLETLIPEEVMRNYLLRFLKRKLTLFEYSPVMLYFLGVQGSGKDTLVQLLERIMGKVARPTTKEFLEMYNGWMLDSYFVQLDEYGNQLTTLKDKEEALGKLKAYTGKQEVQIRQMRTDGFMYTHHVTFISTANSNPFGLEDGDRRIALFPTPNVLIEAPWVEDIVETYDAIMRESKDFCYYLATQVSTATSAEYMKPPETDSKHKLIADSMYASHKLAYALKHGMLDYLKDLCITYSCEKLPVALRNKRVYASDLEELYEVMTDYKGDARSLNKAIRAVGIQIKDTTVAERKDYYYNLKCFEGGPFDADDNN